MCPATRLLAPGLLAAALLLGAAARADDASQPGDAAMTCDQISNAVAQQNAIVTAQTGTIEKANVGSATSPEGTSAVTEMDTARAAIAQRKSDKATARGKTLVALGKTKKCFK